MVERNRLQEAFGRQAGPACEQLLQAGRRLADFRGKRLQRGLVAIVEADLLDHPADGLVVGAVRRDVSFQDGQSVRSWFSYLLDREYRPCEALCSTRFLQSAIIRCGQCPPVLPALRGRQRRGERLGKALAVVRIEEPPIGTSLPCPSTAIPVMPISSWRATEKRAQNGLKRCASERPDGADLLDVEAGARHRDLLARPRRAIVEPEGDIDSEHVEAEEAEDRPGALRKENRADDQPAEKQRAHQHGEAGAARAIGAA